MFMFFALKSLNTQWFAKNAQPIFSLDIEFI